MSSNWRAGPSPLLHPVALDRIGRRRSRALWFEATLFALACVALLYLAVMAGPQG